MERQMELLRLAHTIKRGYEAALRPVERDFDLTRNEVDVLLFLANNPGLNTARDIVELRGLTKSHVCKSVDSLTRRGFLSGLPDPGDRRLVRLVLLPPSGAAVQRARRAQRAFFDRLYRNITPEEQSVLAAVWDKIARNAGKDMEE